MCLHFTQICACGPRKCIILSPLIAALFLYFVAISSLHLMCLLIISSFTSIMCSSSFPLSHPLGLFSFSSVSTLYLVSFAAFCCCCVSQFNLLRAPMLILSHFIHWRNQRGVSRQVTHSSLLHCIHLQQSPDWCAASWDRRREHVITYRDW